MAGTLLAVRVAHGHDNELLVDSNGDAVALMIGYGLEGSGRLLHHRRGVGCLSATLWAWVVVLLHGGAGLMGIVLACAVGDGSVEV